MLNVFYVNAARKNEAGWYWSYNSEAMNGPFHSEREARLDFVQEGWEDDPSSHGGIDSDFEDL